MRGDPQCYLTHAEVARRLDRAAEAIGLEVEEVIALQRTVLPERFESAPPAAPTADVPGTPGKVRALCERAAAGQSLWHARDAGDGIDTGIEVYGNGSHTRGRTGGTCHLRVGHPAYRVRGQAADAAVRRTNGEADPGGGLLTGKQLADRLGVAPETVRRWQREGRIPRARGPDGRWGYSLPAVKAALGGETPPPSQ